MTSSPPVEAVLSNYCLNVYVLLICMLITTMTCMLSAVLSILYYKIHTLIYDDDDDGLLYTTKYIIVSAILECVLSIL